MLDGRGPLHIAEIRLTRQDEEPVGHVEQGCQRGTAKVADLVGRGNEEGPATDGQQHQVERGQQPTRSSSEELREGDASGAVNLAEQDAGDEEAGQHEEQVDTEEAAGQPVGAHVIRNDASYGQCAHAVEGGNVLAALDRCRPRQGLLRRRCHVVRVGDARQRRGLLGS